MFPTCKFCQGKVCNVIDANCNHFLGSFYTGYYSCKQAQVFHVEIDRKRSRKVCVKTNRIVLRKIFNCL